MSDFLSMLWQTAFFFSILRITAPILFAALGAVVSEKAGCSNIGLEGIMMISALFGALSRFLMSISCTIRWISWISDK